jgi:hypothetical protein
MRFPEADEDALRRLAQAWAGAGARLHTLQAEAEDLGSAVAGALGGAAGREFADLWQRIVAEPDGAMPALALVCEELARACGNTGIEVEYAKAQYIGALLLLAGTLAWLAATMWLGGLSALGAPGAIAAAQFTIRLVLTRLVAAVVVGSAITVGLDAAIQSVQILVGHRDDWDWSKTGQAAVDGAIYGAVGGGVFTGAARFAPRLAGSLAGTLGLSGATGVVGSAAAAAVHGQALSGEDLALATVAGVVSGLAPGGRHHGEGGAVSDLRLADVAEVPDVRLTGLADVADVRLGSLADPSIVEGHRAARPDLSALDGPEGRGVESGATLAGQALAEGRGVESGATLAGQALAEGRGVEPGATLDGQAQAEHVRPPTAPERFGLDAGGEPHRVEPAAIIVGGPATPAGTIAAETAASPATGVPSHAGVLSGSNLPPGSAAAAASAVSATHPGIALATGLGSEPATHASSAAVLAQGGPAGHTGAGPLVATDGPAPLGGHAGGEHDAPPTGHSSPHHGEATVLAATADVGAAPAHTTANADHTHPDAATGHPGSVGLLRVSDAEATALVRTTVFATNAGLGFYPAGDSVRAFAHTVQPAEGYVTLDLHGSPDAFHIGNTMLTPPQFAQALRELMADGVLQLPEGTGIKLMSCDTAAGGTSSAAAQLARHLGVSVIAPDKPVWTTMQGSEFVASPVSLWGVFVPKQPPDGRWHHFDPTGAEIPMRADFGSGAQVERGAIDPGGFMPRDIRDGPVSEEELLGKTPAEVAAMIPSDWPPSRPSRSGAGIVYEDPVRLGRQIRVMPGYAAGNRPEPVTHGPYVIVSENGGKLRVALAGNPTLATEVNGG